MTINIEMINKLFSNINTDVYRCEIYQTPKVYIPFAASASAFNSFDIGFYCVGTSYDNIEYVLFWSELLFTEYGNNNPTLSNLDKIKTESIILITKVNIGIDRQNFDCLQKCMHRNNELKLLREYLVTINK